VGESEAERTLVLEALMPQMPLRKPRYLMGVGRPEDIIEAVRRGIDMFDCVMPTRHARNAHLVHPRGRGQYSQRRSSKRHGSHRRGLPSATPAATTAAAICGTWTSAARYWART
jgi:tRNA-guanine family transglycosylase